MVRSATAAKRDKGGAATPPPLLKGGEGVRGRDGTLGISRNGDEGHRILKGLDLAVCAVCCSKRSAAMRNISAS